MVLAIDPPLNSIFDLPVNLFARPKIDNKDDSDYISPIIKSNPRFSCRLTQRFNSTQCRICFFAAVPGNISDEAVPYFITDSFFFLEMFFPVFGSVFSASLIARLSTFPMQADNIEVYLSVCQQVFQKSCHVICSVLLCYQGDYLFTGSSFPKYFSAR